MTNLKPPQSYWNPYLSGVGLGLVLLASFVFAGRGVGVSGALDDFVGSIIGDGSFFGLFNDWLVIEVLGIVAGGTFSGWIAGRLSASVEHGPNISSRTRLALAGLGGVLVGFGSRFAHGCTSGQALSGGALLSVGSWIFMIALFGTAYALAGIMRRAWR